MSAPPAARGGALLVFAKAPRPGRVKTRLCPPLSPAEAADLFSCVLDDVLETSAAIAAQLRLSAFLCIDPWSARDEFARRLEALGAPAAGLFQLRPQRGPDLGARMGEALAAAAGEGYGPLLLRGSDSPTLAVGEVEAALRALEEADLVLRPDRDGGYSLVALRSCPPGDLFHLEMGHPGVLRETVARAGARGLRVRLLPAGFDLDSAADLALLAGLRGHSDVSGCPRTLALLDARNVWEALDGR